MSIEMLIEGAISDPGVPISGYHRTLMEDCFQETLSDVRLHFSPAGEVANRALGSLAFAVDGHICFRPEIDPDQGDAFTYLLAHEVSHILQKRRAKHIGLLHVLPKSDQAFEREANVCAANVLRGKRAIVANSDPHPDPRCYGPAGHYYTAFYTALATGFDYETARKIGLYTQLPDLVSEIDATEAGKGWGKKYGEAMASTAELYISHVIPGKSITEFWQHSQDAAIDKMVSDWQVQAGLHALTGGDAETETTKRTNILSQCAPGSLEFGLAVHAFGDSFAHRDFHNGDKMYGPPFGHLAELVNHAIRADSGWDPHDPDKIVLRKELYYRYGAGLYQIFSAKSSRKPPVDLKEFKSVLVDVSCQTTDEVQGAMLKARVREVCEKTEGTQATSQEFATFYEPPDDAIPWNEFRVLHPDLDPGLLAKALELAAKWCISAEPFRISVHGSWSDLGTNLNNSVKSIPESFLIVTGANLSPTEFISKLYGGMP